MNAPIVAVLPFSNRDFALAVRWLKWVGHLGSHLPNGSGISELLVVGRTNVTEAQWDEIKSIQTFPFYRTIEILTNVEATYPVCANQLFLGALETVEMQFPKFAMLFCEPDTVPMHPHWLDTISEEYRETEKPFMGFWVDHCVPHMAGCGVYPPNWRELAPSIAKCVDPTVGAFDTACAHEIVPQMHRSKTIQQIWRPDPWPIGNLSRIWPSTCLFHQCKDGSLITELAYRYPGFKE